MAARNPRDSCKKFSSLQKSRHLLTTLLQIDIASVLRLPINCNFLWQGFRITSLLKLQYFSLKAQFWGGALPCILPLSSSSVHKTPVTAPTLSCGWTQDIPVLRQYNPRLSSEMGKLTGNRGPWNFPCEKCSLETQQFLRSLQGNLLLWTTRAYLVHGWSTRYTQSEVQMREFQHSFQKDFTHRTSIQNNHTLPDTCKVCW